MERLGFLISGLCDLSQLCAGPWDPVSTHFACLLSLLELEAFPLLIGHGEGIGSQSNKSVDFDSRKIDAGLPGLLHTELEWPQGGGSHACKTMTGLCFHSGLLVPGQRPSPYFPYTVVVHLTSTTLAASRRCMETLSGHSIHCSDMAAACSGLAPSVYL